jgi:hypothetical protein
MAGASRDDGRLINHALLMSVREAEDREASPTAGVIDSQSVKTTEAGTRDHTTTSTKIGACVETGGSHSSKGPDEPWSAGGIAVFSDTNPHTTPVTDCGSCAATWAAIRT